MSEHAGDGHGAGEHAGLFPVPGDGVLARHGDLILLCSLEDTQAADDLLDLLEQVAAAGGDGRQFADAIADVLEGVDRGPSVLAFGPSASGLAITVSGGAWADITTADGSARIEAGHPKMLLRGTVRSAVSGVRGGLSPSDNGVASTDRFSRLDAGTVRAGGLSYYSDGSATARAAAGRRSGRRPAGAAVPVDQMTPSDISGAQTSAMEVPKARGRGTGTSAAKAAAAAAAAQEAAAQQAAAQQAAAQEAAAQQAAAQQAAAAAKDAGSDAEPAAGQADGRGAGAEAGAAVGLAKPADSAGSTPPQATFAPTEAWVTPESSAQERQATELWSGPVSPPDQAGAAQEAPLAGPQQGSAADLQSMEPDVTAPPEPVSGFDPAQGEPFEAVLLLDAGSGSGVDAPAREPLSKVKDMPPGTSSYVSAGPIIQGVYCKNGHFDDPEALFCAICGISMNQQTLVPRPGERPPLGVLLLDDGAVFQLDSDYVIGREPGLDASVAQGKARPLRITDESGIVSRVHARIHLDGWRVLVTDLGSANGTRVLLPAQPADQPLVPQVPIVLATGSQVDLGGRGFRYESHRGR
jgi:hypothetical protein